MHSSTVKDQKGLAIILMVMMIALVTTAFAVKMFSGSGMVQKQADQADQILAYSKSAVLGAIYPGNIPTPDYLSSSETPANFDGQGDGCQDGTKANGLPLTLISANMRCLGRLPWKNLGLAFNSYSESDPVGNMPWYAYSTNLTEPACLIPSVIQGMCLTGPVPYPWLTVRDSRGNVMSNRVAIILFQPGPPINGQIRSQSPLGATANYLDTVVVADCAAPCVPGTYSNADLDNDFIQPATGDTMANDRLLYITIDELMVYLTKRAAGEVKSLLNAYAIGNGQYPWAATLGASQGQHKSVISQTSGMLPVDQTDVCSCTNAQNCSCQFSLLNNVKYVRNSGTWNTAAGACTYTSGTCTCTGAGSCSRTSTNFTCQTDGSCAAVNVVGKFRFDFANYLAVYDFGTGCLQKGPSTSIYYECDSASNLILGLNFTSTNDWIKNKRWEEYFYYRFSSSNTLQAGSKTGLAALLVGTGTPIINAPFAVKGAAQTTPSTSLYDYLDTDLNVDGDDIFESTNKPLSANYNDQVFIIAP